MFPTWLRSSEMHLVLILDLRFYLISDRLCDVMTFLFRPNVIRPFSQRVWIEISACRSYTCKSPPVFSRVRRRLENPIISKSLTCHTQCVVHLYSSVCVQDHGSHVTLPLRIRSVHFDLCPPSPVWALDDSPSPPIGSVCVWRSSVVSWCLFFVTTERYGLPFVLPGSLINGGRGN
jgi:hypothetical protein